MQRDFDEIGLELSPGSFFIPCSGTAVFEYDDGAGRVIAVEIILESWAGSPAHIPIHHGDPGIYGHIHFFLEKALLNHLAYDDDLQELIDSAARKELGYGPTEREML